MEFERKCSSCKWCERIEPDKWVCAEELHRVSAGTPICVMGVVIDSVCQTGKYQCKWEDEEWISLHNAEQE